MCFLNHQAIAIQTSLCKSSSSMGEELKPIGILVFLIIHIMKNVTWRFIALKNPSIIIPSIILSFCKIDKARGLI